MYPDLFTWTRQTTTTHRDWHHFRRLGRPSHILYPNLSFCAAQDGPNWISPAVEQTVHQRDFDSVKRSAVFAR